MRLTTSIAAAGFLVFAESAHASSPIPSNYVDDFGPLEVSDPTATTRELPVAHASPIPSNFIDDFGSLEVSDPTATTRERLLAHASPIPSNFIDDFGLTVPSEQAAAPTLVTGQAAPIPSNDVYSAAPGSDEIARP